MDKLKMQSPDVISDNIIYIAERFPNVITETVGEDGNVVRSIDFEKLHQELTTDIVEGNEERYQFTWPGKRDAVRLANSPIDKTLRPCREESVDFDNTQNLYIEGDNLDVLKLLQENYLGKVKMIYIDPPYNTGNDFVYADDFRKTSEEFKGESGLFDEEGNQLTDRLVKNTEGNGRFHTDWLNMIYPRLKVARNLLSEDGVIFISIGQDELKNIHKVCDEIFGENNYLGIISRQMKSGGGSQGKYFAHNIDYVLVYARQYDAARYFRGEMSEELVKKVYNQVQKDGPKKGEFYRTMGLYQSSLGVRPSLRYYIQCPDGELVIPPGTTFPNVLSEGVPVLPISTDGVWRWSYELFKSELEKGNIEFKKTNSGTLINNYGKPASWNIYTKIWLKDRIEEGTIPNDLLTKYENRHSSKELSSLKIPFDFPKPVGLIKYLIKILAQEKDITILDFFSGSATTAHSVMQLNSEDGGNRKFILVQLPEKTEEASEAYKAGYENICQIGKERIRRAGKKIIEEQTQKKTEAGMFAEQGETKKLDVGFRVLKLDTSNMNEVYYTPEEFDVNSLFNENIKSDRTEEDLLFQVMLDLGVELSAKIEKSEVAGKTVWSVSDGYLLACFDEDVNESAIIAIAKQKPLYFVMRDSSLSSDNVADNFDQIFEEYSKDTIRKIL